MFSRRRGSETGREKLYPPGFGHLGGRWMIALPILAAAAVAAPAAADMAFPSLAEVEEALNDLEKCRGLTGPECPPPERRYEVHGAKCMAIPPLEGRRSVTCRVDETLTYADPKHGTTRSRDLCLRLAELESPAGPR